MPEVHATLHPSGVGGERVAHDSAEVRRVGIAVAVAISLACLAVPVVRGGSPEIFLCFSAAYVVAGGIGWMLRPGNPTGPLLQAIGVSGAVILQGAAPISWIGTVTLLGATTATVLLFLVLLISPTGRFLARVDAVGFAAIAVTYVVIVLMQRASRARIVEAGDADDRRTCAGDVPRLAARSRPTRRQGLREVPSRVAARAMARPAIARPITTEATLRGTGSGGGPGVPNATPASMTSVGAHSAATIQPPRSSRRTARAPHPRPAAKPRITIPTAIPNISPAPN